MSTKQELAEAIRAYQERENQMTIAKQQKGAQAESELKGLFQMVNQWVYGTPGLTIDEGISTNQDQKLKGQKITFAGKEIRFTPAVRKEELEVKVHGLEEEDQFPITLRQYKGQWQVYDAQDVMVSVLTSEYFISCLISKVRLR